MKSDPDDQKPPHYDINSLMRAFEQAWQQLKDREEQHNEIKHTPNH